jgi:hypothetical protein
VLRPTALVTAVGLASLIVGMTAGRFLLPARSENPPVDQSPPARVRTFVGKPGPWGQLHFVQIGIEPPPDQLDAERDYGRPLWFFRSLSRPQTEQLLRAAHPPANALRALLDESFWKETPEGTWVGPTDEALLGLDPASRGRIYGALADIPQNTQRFPVPMRPDSIAERTGSSRLQPTTLDLWQRLLYPSGKWIFFADAPFVLSKLPQLEERRRFISMLARNVTYLVSLKVDASADIEGIARYWTFRGRSKESGPLLQSLSRVPGGSELDLAHLLPPMARRRIYTYAKPSPNGVVDPRNCFWSAMNFFAETPEDRFTNADEMMRVLTAEYQLVDEPTFGDVVVMFDAQNQPIHAASYLADNLLFTKNGHTPFHPWMYATLDEIHELYSAMLPRSLPFTIRNFRRRPETRA